MAEALGGVCQGISDGRLDLQQHKHMDWTYDRAVDGNVVLTAEVDLAAVAKAEFVVAAGFGRNEYEAAHRARASLLQGFDAARETYVADWQNWHEGLVPVELARSGTLKTCTKLAPP